MRTRQLPGRVELGERAQAATAASTSSHLRPASCTVPSGHYRDQLGLGQPCAFLQRCPFLHSSPPCPWGLDLCSGHAGGSRPVLATSQGAGEASACHKRHRGPWCLQRFTEEPKLVLNWPVAVVQAEACFSHWACPGGPRWTSVR